MPSVLPPTAVGSASIRVLAQVAGPRQSARVLHAGEDAVYLDVEGTCVGLLAIGAIQVPCGVRTTLPSLPFVAPDATAVVGDGAVTLPGLEVLVAHIVDTTVPVLPPEVAMRAADRLAGLAGSATRAAREVLAAPALDALSRGDAAGVTPLLGLGPGLTPLGDDVLGGWLATAVATRSPALADVRSAVALSATERTTTLSATLLACAAHGEVVPEHRNLLVALGGDDTAALGHALARLLEVGDTSGAGAVLGTLCALHALSSLAECVR